MAFTVTHNLLYVPTYFDGYPPLLNATYLSTENVKLRSIASLCSSTLLWEITFRGCWLLIYSHLGYTLRQWVQTRPPHSHRSRFFTAVKLLLLKYYNVSLTTRRTINSHDLRKTKPFGGKRKLKFQRRWLMRWQWLAYSPSLDGAFCKVCFLFAPEVGAGCGRSATWAFGAHQVRQVERCCGRFQCPDEATDSPVVPLLLMDFCQLLTTNRNVLLLSLIWPEKHRLKKTDLRLGQSLRQ